MTRKNIIAQMVSSNNKIVSSRFFEQSQFEQMIMSLPRVQTAVTIYCPSNLLLLIPEYPLTIEYFSLWKPITIIFFIVKHKSRNELVIIKLMITTFLFKQKLCTIANNKLNFDTKREKNPKLFWNNY
jgi:hypothetical protein